MHKERKETTHVRIGERNIHQNIKKISTMYVKKKKMVTRPKVQEQCIYKRKKRKDT